MNNQQIAIVVIVSAFTLSGIIINLWKRVPTKINQSQNDGRTLLLFRLIIPTAIIVSLSFYFLDLGNILFPTRVIYLGYILVFLGLAIRWIAVVSLGKSFTVKITIQSGQTLKTNGIYNRIRHPSYTGLLIYYLGLGLAMHNWICIILLIVLPVYVVKKRIDLEETVLLAHFKDEFKAYMEKSWKLFPFVY